MRLRDVDRNLNYDKSKKVAQQKRRLSPRKTAISTSWHRTQEKTPGSKLLGLILLLAVTFFSIAVVVAIFIQIAGLDKSISPSKINIIVQGPITAVSDEDIPLIIRVVNRNSVTLEVPKLIVDYPDGTYTSTSKSNPLRTQEIPLDDIESNGFVEHLFNQRFFGEEGEEKNLKLTLEYRVPGSYSVYRSETTVHTIALRGDTVSITKPSLTRAVSGKELKISFSVTSRVSFTLPSVVVRVRYPAGFVPLQESTDAVKTAWTFTDFPGGATKNIQVTGIIRGEPGVRQTFVAEVFASPAIKDVNAVRVAKQSEEILIEKSFLRATVLLDDSENDTIVVSPKDTVSGTIRWQNEETTALKNVTLVATITGTGLDESSVTVINGHYDINNSQIVWDQTKYKEFLSINPNQFGELSFSFKILPSRIEFASENKYVTVSISAMANRVGYDFVDSISDIEEKTVRVRSAVQISSTTLHETSRVANAGSLPPRVGQETTYVLHYFIKNDGNILSDAVLTIPLSNHVTFTGVVDGVSTKNFQYNTDKHTITITIPQIDAFGTNASSSVEVQVSLIPKSTDVGHEVPLVGKATFIAQDEFVNRKYQGTFSELTTRLTTESNNRETRLVQEAEGG